MNEAKLTYGARRSLLLRRARFASWHVLKEVDCPTRHWLSGELDCPHRGGYICAQPTAIRRFYRHTAMLVVTVSPGGLWRSTAGNLFSTPIRERRLCARSSQCEQDFHAHHQLRQRKEADSGAGRRQPSQRSA